MNRSVSQTAKILGVDPALVKKWANLFKDYLSPEANPPKGQARVFGHNDLLVLAYVSEKWESDSDLESIKIGLNLQEYLADGFREHLYMWTPLLREPPDDLDETWKRGILLTGGNINDFLELARNYRWCAESLLNLGLRSGETHYWASPVLFNYRHALELYLKILGQISKPTHSLSKCLAAVEKLQGKRIDSPMREWILEFDKLDPGGTSFRYTDVSENKSLSGEDWVDLEHLKFAMDRVFSEIDQRIINRGPGAKRIKMRK